MGKTGGFRWRILALLFMATTINYMDRSILGVLGPTLKEKVFGWSDMDYAYINMAFKTAYAIGLLTMGAIIDKVGTKLGYTISISIWTIFGVAQGFVTAGIGVVGFALARFGLGFGEAGNFPACIKTVAEWFPKKERALATGIFNAGANVGAILAPLAIPIIVANDGTNWQFAFFITALFSLIWIFLWNRYYKRPELHCKLTKSEMEYISSDSEAESADKIPWKSVLPVRETWAFAISKLPDAVWWFYLFWGGFFLKAKFGLELKGLAVPIIIIYVMADLGSIGGGWLSSSLMKRGWSTNRARKTTLLICALAVLPVVFAAVTDNQWIAVALISLAAAGHQAWSANVFTLVSDVFPKKATASVVGIGGMMGAVAGILADFFLGKVLVHSGANAYMFAFFVAGSLYLVALLFIHLIMPQMTPLDENLKRVAKS